MTLFKPAGVPGRDLEQLPLAVDELEAIRLVDLEGLSHEQAATAMGVSRQTVGRVLERGRGKVAEALVGGKAILIGGGQYRVEPRQLCCASCGNVWTGDSGAASSACPACGSTDLRTCWGGAGRCGELRGRAMAAACVPAEAVPAVRDEAGGEVAAARDVRRHHHHSAMIEQPGTESDPMSDTNGTTLRIAIPSEAPGGLTAQRSGHFGRCECFTMVDVVDGKVGDVEVLVNAPHVEGGCMAPVLVLAEHNVDAIVVDGIGGRPLMGFNQVGIAVHAGVGADVQTTVHAFIAGGLPVVGFDNACQH